MFAHTSCPTDGLWCDDCIFFHSARIRAPGATKHLHNLHSCRCIIDYRGASRHAISSAAIVSSGYKVALSSHDWLARSAS